MGILRSLGTVRAAYNPWDDFWYGAAAHDTAAGVDVDAESAMGLTALWNGVTQIANTVAKVPLRLYRRRRNGGSEEAREDPRFRLVFRHPNQWQTSFGWRQMLQGHLLLRGNAYNQKVYRANGVLDALVPLHPTRMTIRVVDGEIWYEYLRTDGTRRLLSADEVLHLRGLSGDGIIGYSPVTVLRESLGAVIGTDRFAARFFRNNAQPKGALKAPGILKKETKLELRDQWNQAHAGVDNQHKVAILDGGLEWQTIGFSAEDSQMVASRTFNINEVARILNIPPHKIKELSRATFSNIEHQGIEWVVDTIQPWIENWEQQLDADLLTEREQATMYFKFDLKGEMRGDSQQRAAYMQTRFNMGSLSPNDIRALEDEDPIPGEGGDRYYVQQNLMPLDMVDDVMTKRITPPPAPPPALPPGTDDTVADRLRGFAPVLSDVAARMLHREITAAQRAARKKDWPAFRVWADEYFGEAAGTAAQQFLPLAASMARVAGCTEIRALGEYAVAMAQEAASESLAAIRSLFRTTEPEQLEPAVESLLESWRQVRPGEIAERGVARAIATFVPSTERIAA